MGSALFCYVFLRARSIPVPLAWLGLVSSLLWVVGLPLQMMKVASGPVMTALYAAMAVFEVSFAFWLIFRGVSRPVAERAA